MNKKKLILFDWDNTIATGTGQIDDIRLKPTIQSKIREGWFVGLNSDTPMRRLQSWWKLLEMNGPIIAEKGAVVWWPDNKEIVVSQTEGFFNTLRNQILLSLAQQIGISVFIGDSTNFIRSLGRLAVNDSILVAIDAYRTCSIGLFVRRFNNGLPYNDISAAIQVHDLLRSIVPYNPLTSPLHLNSEHCFISMNSLDTDKTKGTQFLLNRWGEDAEVIMVGDSPADYLSLPQVTHFAVGNAQTTLKEKAVRTATKNYSAGCVELLGTL
jgi:hypothetical protein